MLRKPNNVSAQRKYLYGVTRDQYQEMLCAQEGKCAACGQGETMLGRSGVVRSLSVDHCHKTGHVRGLLCDRCNNILGRAKDDVGVLRRLASYIEVTSTAYAPVDTAALLNELKGDLTCLPA